MWDAEDWAKANKHRNIVKLIRVCFIEEKHICPGLNSSIVLLVLTGLLEMFILLNKLTSVFHGSVLLLIMNLVITLSKCN